MENRKNDPVSLAKLIASALIFGTIGIFRRYIPVSSAMLACFRGLIGAGFLSIFCAVRRHSLRNNIGAKRIGLLILTGALMGLNWILLFEAYNYTTVAVATLCYYMEPTIVILASAFIFKDKLTVRRIVCVIVSLIGMAMVSGVVGSGLPAAGDLKGILLGLGAACLYSSVVIMNKKLSGIDVYEKTIIELLGAAVVMIPYLLIGGTGAMNAGEGSLLLPIVMIGVVGLVHTGIAYAFYFGSMDGLRTGTIAIFSYLDPITALILSAIVLGETMTVWGIIGAVMIIAAAIISEKQG